MASITFGAVAGNWSDDTKWVGGVEPTAADDVFFDASSADCVINATAVCRSINCTGYTGELTHTAAIGLSIGDGTAGASNIALKFVSGMTYTLGSTTTSVISFISTSATVQTIDFAGKDTGDVTFNAASNGSWQLNGAWGTSAAAQTVTLTDGTLDTNDQTCYWGKFSSSNNNTRALDLGSSAINILGTGTVWTFQTYGNLTFTCGTSVITMSGTDVTMYGGVGTTFYTINFTGAGYARLGGSGSMTNLYRIGTAAKTCIMTLAASPNTITGEFKIQGNSLTNRLLVNSSTLGTARSLTITGATISNCQNVDFEDVTFANGGSNVDLSSITGGSGDCGGNTISGGGTLSFTTADDWYWQTTGAGTYNFSDYHYWFTATNGGGSQMASTRCPLPQDNCYFDADSVSGATVLDQDLLRVCKDLDFTGCDALSVHFNNNNQTFHGSLILVSNLTISTVGTYGFYFKGRGSHTLTVADKSLGFSNVFIQSIGGTYALGSNFLSTNLITHYNGTFSAGAYNLTCRAFVSNSGLTRTINMGSGTWTMNGYSGAYVWVITTTGLTFNKDTANIAVNILDAYDMDFRGGGLTYNNITIDSGTNTAIIEESNTFGTFTITAGSKVQFTDGTDTTVSSFVATGDAVDGITIGGTSTAGFKLSDSAGTNTVHYCTIDYCTCEGGALWIATDNCVDGGHNSASGGDGSTGWLFTAETTTSTTTTTTSSSTTTTTTSSSTSTSTSSSITTTSSSTSSSITTTSSSTSTTTTSSSTTVTTTSSSTSSSVTTTSSSTTVTTTSSSTSITTTSSSTSSSTTTTSSSTSTSITTTSSSTSSTVTTTSSSTSITTTSSSTTVTTTSSSTSVTTTSSSTSSSITTTSSSTSVTTTSSSTTTTSSSTSTTTTSSSTTISTTTTLDPDSGGLAFGEQNPIMGETPISWVTWGLNGGEIIGDGDWGKMSLSLGESGWSGVYDFGNSIERIITVTENRYGVGQGDATLQIRGQDEIFTKEAVDPAWENYIGPVAKTWRYIQIKEVY